MTAALLVLAAIIVATVACIAWDFLADLIAARLDAAYEQGHSDAMDAVHSAGIEAGVERGWHDEGSAA